jgi:hypothetical protein
VDDWVEDFADDADLDSQTPETVTQSLRVPRLRPGWPFLQLIALKECIKVADYEKGNVHLVCFEWKEPFIFTDMRIRL